MYHFTESVPSWEISTIVPHFARGVSQPRKGRAETRSRPVFGLPLCRDSGDPPHPLQGSRLAGCRAQTRWGPRRPGSRGSVPAPSAVGEDDGGCEVNGRRYRDGETFQPHCRLRCRCQDGGLTCLPLCSEDVRLPSADCPRPRRVELPGKCCPEWVCDQAAELQAPGECGRRPDRATAGR